MLVLKILVWWIVLSCTAGPLVAWAFFHPVRREDEMRRRGRFDKFQLRYDVHQLRPRRIVEFPKTDQAKLGSAAYYNVVTDSTVST